MVARSVGSRRKPRSTSGRAPGSRERSRRRPDERGLTWKTPALASKRPGDAPSLVQSDQMEVASSRRGSSRSRPSDESVRLEQRPGAPDVIRGQLVQEAGRLPADPRAVVIEQHLARWQRRDDLDSVPRKLVLRPDPAPEQDRRSEVGPRRQDDRVRVDPVAGCGDHPLRARPVHGQPVDEGVGEDGEVRPAPRRRRGTRNPCSSVPPRRRSRGARSTPTGCDGSSGSSRNGKPSSPAASRNATWSGAGSSVFAAGCGATRGPGRGTAPGTRRSSQAPIRRSPRACRPPPCTRCAWSSRRSPAPRATARPRRPPPSRA